MRAIVLPHTVTTDTVLEFDFRSSVEGEVHAVGTNAYRTAAGVFKVHGTQGGGYTYLEDYASTAPDYKHYAINLGDYATGEMTRLWFMNDHDVVDPDSEGYFANVRIYEEAAAAPASAAGSGSGTDAALLLPWDLEEDLSDRLLAKSNGQPVVQDPVASSNAAIDMILGGLIPPSSASVTDAIDRVFTEQGNVETGDLLDDELLEVLP